MGIWTALSHNSTLPGSNTPPNRKAPGTGVSIKTNKNNQIKKKSKITNIKTKRKSIKKNK